MVGPFTLGPLIKYKGCDYSVWGLLSHINSVCSLAFPRKYRGCLAFVVSCKGCVPFGWWDCVCSMSGVEWPSGTLAGFNPHEPWCQAGIPYPGFWLFQETCWWNIIRNKKKQWIHQAISTCQAGSPNPGLNMPELGARLWFAPFGAISFQGALNLSYSVHPLTLTWRIISLSKWSITPS